MKSFLTKIILLSFLLPFIIINPSQAATERRIALVIGNSAYSSGPLKNPVNDATDIAATLQRLGFSVIIKKNASQRVMEESIREFGNKLKRGGVGLFYYAGHGLQVSGVNYLIPIAAKINEESDVKYEAIDANKVLDAMANANNGLNIVILDACRDNPFTRSFRDATRGLAIVSSAPVGTFISYSTGPGGVARDGEGRNSPYAAALIKHMTGPGQPVEQVFKSVRQTLATQSGGKQIPWELSSLQGNFFFTSGSASAETAADHSSKVTQTEKIKLTEHNTTDALDLAMAKIKQKKENEENLKAERQEQIKALLADIKKYKVIVKEDIDVETKSAAWKALTKKYPSWSADVGTGQWDKILARAADQNKDGGFKFDGRFIAYDNGTVLDTRTNLMWSARDNGSDINWPNAKSYCEYYEGGGYRDWRMPTQDELAALYNVHKSQNSECGSAPIHVATDSIHLTCYSVWASETRDSTAAYFNFARNERLWNGQSGNIWGLRALPVRSTK